MATPDSAVAPAARAAAPGAGSGSRPQSRQAQQQEPQDRPDWRWQIAKSLLMYLAFQAIMGQNGLMKWYQGKAQWQQERNASARERVSGRGGVGSVGGNNVRTGTLEQHQHQHQKRHAQTRPVAGGPVGRVAKGTMASALYTPDAALDFYVFITAGEAPTADDIAMQHSTLVPGGKGARQGGTRDAFDLSAQDFAALMDAEPSAEALLAAQYWYPKDAAASQSSSPALAAFRWSNVSLSDGRLQRDADVDIRVPEHVKHNNGSLWAEIAAAPAGQSPVGPGATRTRKLLTRLYPAKHVRQEKKLFERSESEDGRKVQEVEEKNNVGPAAAAGVLPFLNKEPAEIIPYWHKNLTLALVGQGRGIQYPLSQLPPPLLQHLHVVEDEKGDIVLHNEGKVAVNYPVIFPNDFWHLREHMHPINATHETLPLHVSLYTTSFFKFQMLAAMSDSFDKQPGMAASEVDTIKLTLLDNSPWYLGLTVGVGLLHSLFEFLAFSSDVSHWRKKENMAGVSLGSILTNVIVQLIILLYLLDQSHETSWMILGSQAVGIVIEAWKITRAVTVGISPRKRGEGRKWLQWCPYRLDIQDRHVLTEEERRTQQFDRLAFRIVSYLAVPLLGAYTVYSALYQTHKGWWSFFIGTLCSFVYAFGFVSLIPQLIVNYKLKSTAGMNSKTFVYKILGTVVDDFAAFAIRQPMLHRLACFRDDIVFLVYLYQRWIYGVDPTRVNEFGQVLEDKPGKESGTAGDGAHAAAEDHQLETKKDK